MTATIATVARAPQADGLAIFNATLGALETTGWTRERVDTYVRSDHDWTVRHQYNAGCWELHLERAPNHRRMLGGVLPADAGPRTAKIDLNRPPLASSRAVLSELFGVWHGLLAHPVSAGNEKEQA